MTADAEGNFHHSAQHPDMIGGMSLRDYFAARVMQSHCAAYFSSIDEPGDYDMGAGTAEVIAVNAYNMADAMLKAREQ